MLRRLRVSCALALVTTSALAERAAPAPAAPPEAVAPAAAPVEQPLPAAPAEPVPAAAPVAPLPPGAAPKVDSAEPRALPLKRSRFFATLQLGGGYFHATSGVDQDRRSFRGGSISGLLAFGGRVGHQRNVSLSAAFLRDQVVGLRSKDQLIDGDEPDLRDATFGLWAVGFLVDFAAQREPGLHFQALAGVGALSVSRTSGDPDDPTGLMLSLAAGYDFKVSQDFAVGALLRATYAPLDVNEVSGTSVNVLVPALLLTASTR